MKLAVVGATGMVGRVILKVLEERNFPVDELIPVASERSVGKKVEFNGKEISIVLMETAIKMQPNIALFSAGGDTSKQWAPEFAKVGTTVIDNSSAWRMNPEIPLVVPEINADILTPDHKIIANPNCSTIQLVMVLNPLNKRYDIKRVVVSTYQSVTGTGKEAVEQLEGEINGSNPKMKYPYPIFKNALPHCDVFEEGGYTKEELKLTRETQKILDDRTIALTATAIRVPVQGGHSESVNVEFNQAFDESELRKILHETPGVVLQDNPETNTYPMPIYAEGKDDVFVGRIRRDFSQDNTVNMWIVADNLRKGAATNAVQIAEYLVQNNLVKNFSLV
ncbi:aspartate-semialdehyde dehydrogenase [Moheibacter lacus]|uniref:Aspartate-semialdehyde dehydrogenase n=1 Tax=Moheibacter lacus TaxID=2745851 RepID=A0A838ZRD4_9FLAO|nr:aspartate-semialdehyde dehydrogenase [Moheibacter lacus]MBA5629032.1 aspartate-semialdehyde dehydrogenase [Moheibacter lacus]